MTVEHDESRKRFVARVGGDVAELRYARADAQTIDLQHTAVPEHAEGQGVGGEFARAAFEYAREHNLRVVPSCPFIQTWLAHHPDQRDVVAGETSSA